MKLLVTAMVVSTCVGLASAQSFNVDVNTVDVPGSAFGGAAGQPGYWNNLANLPESPIGLLGLDGWFTAVTINAIALGDYSTFSVNDSYASGDFARLMEDGWRAFDDEGSFVFQFRGLEPGAYFVYTYSDLPNRAEKDSAIGLDLYALAQRQLSGGTHGTNTFIQNATHARHYVELAPGGVITIGIIANSNVNSARAVVNGLQVQKLPRRLYVNGAASGTGDGLSWTNAFTTLQDAVEAVANFGGAITEIWVAGGVYHPTVDIDRTRAFRLVNGVTIYGGFAGTETSLAQRDPQANVTTLSGNIGGPLPFDNSFHVIDTWDNDVTAVLDGFTVMSGRAVGTFGWDDKGGGMYIQDGSPTIRNCRFLLNYAEYGGAVNIDNGTPTFVNCLFQNNSADEEGGAIRYVNLPETGLMKVSHCRFIANDVAASGGAIDAQAGLAWISNCQFTGNFASLDGGAIHSTGSGTSVSLINCSIVGNHAVSDGGGVCAANTGGVVLNNTIVWDNTSSASAGSLVAQLAKLPGCTATISYSCLQSYNLAALPGFGNTDADPQFVNADGGDGYGDLNDDLRLAAGSPLIDAGNSLMIGSDLADIDADGVTNELTPRDLAGNARRIDDLAAADTGLGGAPIADMGAYERMPVLRGDVNCDGLVNNFDIDAFVLAVTDPLQYVATYPGCAIESADVNADGSVNNFDIDAFIACVLVGGC